MENRHVIYRFGNGTNGLTVNSTHHHTIRQS